MSRRPAHPVVIEAHRGLPGGTENTLSAFQGSWDLGFRAFEMDVRCTADGEVVVLHDAGIERTTDGNGRVADMQYDELVGYHTGAGPVPRLDDVLAAFAGRPVRWNIEIKARIAARDTTALLQKHEVLDRAVVSSMDPEALRRAHVDDLATALIVMGPMDAYDIDEAVDIGCAWLNLDHAHLQAKNVQDVHDAGFFVGAWTVNDVAKAQELVAWGVDSVITDLDAVRVAIEADA